MEINLVPCLVVRNEEYFIPYVLTPLLKQFDYVIMVDTGSTDRTVKLAKVTANYVNRGRLSLIEKDLGDNAIRIGDAKNHLMKVISPSYMLLVDGDEIYPETELVKIKEFVKTLDPKYEVCMTTGRNVFQREDGSLFESLSGNMYADRIFRPDVRWTNLDYPFEGHELEEKVARGVVKDTPFWYWHTRHLLRSSKEQDAYFRETKRSYYKPAGKEVPIPHGWHGEKIMTFQNPYDGSEFHGYK